MFTAKKQKKIYREIDSHDEKLNGHENKLSEHQELINILYTEKVYGYFILFCADMLFDRIGEIFKLWSVINYHRGIGYLEGGVAVFAIIQMWRFARRIKK